jgi:molybdenum cofactor cytidylyltransferase
MRSFVILPAAGRSRRMGQPKLLMPWGQTTVIEHVLHAWQSSQVDDPRLLSICKSLDVHVVAPPTAPPQMKHSVQYGLEYIQQEFAPGADDRWLLCPADTPKISAVIIDQALAAARSDPSLRIVIPVYQGRRGHPVVFPWILAEQVFALGENEGVNAVVRRNSVLECFVEDDGILEDLDTPDQYNKLHDT